MAVVAAVAAVATYSDRPLVAVARTDTELQWDQELVVHKLRLTITLYYI